MLLKTSELVSAVRRNMKRRGLIAMTIFLIALATRIAFVNYVKVNPLSEGDGRALETMGISILHGQTARSAEGYAIRMPVFPFLIAQVYRFGESHRNIYLAQAVIGALSALVLFALLLRFSLSLAVVGALVFSFHPLMLFFSEQLLTENTHIFLLLLTTYFAFRTLDNRLWAFALGPVWGLLILTRSEGMLTMLPVVIGVGLLSRQNKFFRIGIPVLLALITVSPWLYRNYKVVGHVTLQSAVGWNFYVAFNPTATGNCTEPAQLAEAPQQEMERSKFYFRKGLDFIKEHPLRAVTLMGAKQAYLWQSWGQRALVLADILVLPFSLIGVFLTWRNKEYLLLMAPIVSISSIFLIFQAIPRYRVPTYPFLICLAAVAYVRLWQTIRERIFEKNNQPIPDNCSVHL